MNVRADVLSTYRRAYQAFTDGELSDATRLLEELVARAPVFAEAWNLLGVVQDLRSNLLDADRAFERALSLQPSAGTLVNRGQTLQKMGRLDQAANCFISALRHDPKHARAWVKLASVEEARGRIAEALQAYQHAQELVPLDPRPMGDALALRRASGDWNRDAEKCWIRAFNLASHVDSPPLLMLALPDADASTQLNAARTFARSQWSRWFDKPPLAPRPRPAAGRALRVGYLSSDLRDHAIAYLLLDVVASHDRARVRPVAYALPPRAQDAWQSRARAVFDDFIDLDGMDDETAARRIAADAPDILIDLNGHTRHARSGILARRPCAIQIAWLGYVGSLGERRLADYLIGDPIATPGDRRGDFAETLALMPRCFQPNGEIEGLPPPPPRSVLGLPEDALVIGCFNQTFKFHEALWDGWCEILRSVPAAVLWLAHPPHSMGIAVLQAQAEKRGVDPARLLFAPLLPRDEHIRRLQAIDIALDTFPYNGGTTTSDLLRAGVPLFAFAGDTFAGRMTASLLHAAGLGQHVLRDQRSVVQEVIRLALDPQALSRVRQRVTESVSRSGLFDPRRFADEFETLLEAVHRRSLHPVDDVRLPVKAATSMGNSSTA